MGSRFALLKTSFDRSRLRIAIANSVIVHRIPDEKAPGSASWVRTSRVCSGLTGLPAALTSTVRTSRIAQRIETAREWVDTSFLYRWLTAEPEPEVIVIDLRETVTVGPLIGLLDRGIAGFERSYRHSRLERLVENLGEQFRQAPVRAVSTVGLGAVLVSLLMAVVAGSGGTTGLLAHGGLILIALVGTRQEMTMAELCETRAYGLLVAILEPPEIDDPRIEGNDDPPTEGDEDLPTEGDEDLPTEGDDDPPIEGEPLIEGDGERAESPERD